MSLPLRIVVTGPESAGKTTLTRRLARRFGSLWVPEYARFYVERLDRPYEEEDLLAIAGGQILWEAYVAHRLDEPPAPLFVDTSLEVIRVWSEVRYGRCHPWILEQLARRRPDLYLLCDVDLPWMFDPLREHPDPRDRERLFDRYRAVLGETGVPVEVVRGRGEERLRRALAAVRTL